MQNTHRNFVVIVSGLPRSGTSLLMQMLAAGGLPLLTDGVRKADEDNRRGFYELEAVKKTKSDASWLAGAMGKVVKVVYRLLYELPPDYQYRVVFLQRRMEEVLASQKVMLQRHGKETDADDEAMMRIFRKELAKVQEWLRAQPNFRVLNVDYNQLVVDPRVDAEEINEFLGGGLNLEAMAAAVDPTQYRNRR
ncbi:MAG: sulfotransferase domain-containing protein [Thermoguttaceae bacterium]